MIQLLTIERIVQALEARGCRPQGYGFYWRADCPAHSDSERALHIREVIPGYILMYCTAGCRAEAIGKALGLILVAVDHSCQSCDSCDYEPVYLCGSGIAAKALLALGLLATTWVDGATGAYLTDWSPLAGRRVFIVPDNDGTSRQHAERIARLCLAAEATEVRILDWAHIMPGRQLPCSYGPLAAVAECQGRDDLIGLRAALWRAAALAQPVSGPTKTFSRS